MQHVLVPKHEIMKEEEIPELEKKYTITKYQLPRILKNDAAISQLNAKVGDVIEITRESPIVGKIKYYRVVVLE